MVSITNILDWVRGRARDPEIPRLPVSPPGKTRHGIDELMASIPRYPPFLEGLPVVKPGQLVATQAEMIDRIHQTLPISREEFAHYVMPVFLRFARYVQMLPASDAHHHRGAGGMFRHGIEVAYFAARSAEGEVFVRLDRWASERKVLEPRYRVATCVAGLLHDLGKAVSNVSVMSIDGRHVWMPHSDPLYDWARHHKLKRYFLRWRPGEHNRHPRLGLNVVEHILDRSLKDWFNMGGAEINEDLLDAIAGIESPTNKVMKLVEAADRESTARDCKSWRQLSGTGESLGVPVSKHLVDAMRRLHKSGKWRVNGPNSRLWHVGSGRDSTLFVVWPGGAEDILSILSEDRMPGIPRDPATLAEILVEDGVAEPFVDKDGERYSTWRIAPEYFVSAGRGSVVLQAVRLRGTDTLMDFPPPPDKGKVMPPVEGLEEAPEVARPPQAPAPIGSNPDTTIEPESPPPETGSTPVVKDARHPSAPDVDDIPLPPPMRSIPIPPRPVTQAERPEQIAPAATVTPIHKPKDPSPESGPGESDDQWFGKRPDVGPHLLTLAAQLKEKKLQYGEDFGFFEGKKLAVQSRVLLHIAPRMVPMLDQRRMIFKDRNTPMIMTRQVIGIGQAVVLSDETSRHVLREACMKAADFPPLNPKPANASKRKKRRKDQSGRLNHAHRSPGVSAPAPSRLASVGAVPQPSAPSAKDDEATDTDMLASFEHFLAEQGMKEAEEIPAAVVHSFASLHGFPVRKALRTLVRSAAFASSADGGLVRIPVENVE
jgi:hypothetical protein